MYGTLNVPVVTTEPFWIIVLRRPSSRQSNPSDWSGLGRSSPANDAPTLGES